MTIDQLKFIILQNRQQLAFLYEHKQFLKDMKRYADENNMIADEYDAHNCLKATSKQVAKLVEVQKALKADVRYALHVQRVSEADRVRRIKVGFKELSGDA